MRYVEVGGVRLSVIGLGTWQFGSREWGYGKAYAERGAGDITRKALDLGVNLVDTAEIYGFGESERIVGRAIAERRDEVFLATKVLPIMPIAPIVIDRGRRSARRLGVKTIDLYQVHWPNPLVRDGTTMEGMRRLRQEGIVDHVGVSNYPLKRWQAAERALGSPVLSNQVQYSLAARKPDADLVPFAALNDRLIIAYSPLAQGFLSGRYDASNRPGGVRAGNTLFLPENLERGTELLEALRSIAKSHDATPAQVALAWVIHHPNVVAIPGASSVEQLTRNTEAADLPLSDEEFAQLSDASDRFHPAELPAVAPQLIRERLRR
jgi:aryl-alcohol dehydrogenase-like predicted oxidoreductase